MSSSSLSVSIAGDEARALSKDSRVCVRKTSCNRLMFFYDKYEMMQDEEGGG